MNATAPDVLIQGAGIGGLTPAIALQQRGYSVPIIERSATLSETGAGIWMAANPMQVFARLGFAQKVVEMSGVDRTWAYQLTIEEYGSGGLNWIV